MTTQAATDTTPTVKAILEAMPDTADEWEITVTEQTISLQVGEHTAHLPSKDVATKLLDIDMERKWLPIAARYISPDESVILIEKDSCVIDMANGESLRLPWTYFLFHSDNNVEVFFRPFVLLGSKNPFGSFFLNKSRYENNDPEMNFESFDSTRDYVEAYISSIKEFWIANNCFDTGALDVWVSAEMDRVPNLSRDIAGPGEDGYDRVEVLTKMFGPYAHDVTLPNVDVEISGLFGVEEGKTLIFSDLAKVMEQHKTDKASVYTQFLRAFRSVAGI